jgi:hypothetical protein
MSVKSSGLLRFEQRVADCDMMDYRSATSRALETKPGVTEQISNTNTPNGTSNPLKLGNTYHHCRTWHSLKSDTRRTGIQSNFMSEIFSKQATQF